jgi:mycothiol synthase
MSTTQLKMIWERSETPAEIPLPEGFSVRAYTPEDKPQWINLWHLGDMFTTVDDESSYEAMVTDIGRLGFQPERDTLLICDPTGKTVATISSFVHTDPKDFGNGHIHMVSADPSVRGKGIGNAMMSMAMRRLYDAGCKRAILRTDDNRLPAIKSYLKLGFKPDLSGEGMAERWNAIYKKLGPSAAGDR